MAKNFFNRYIWLIDTIRSHGYITFSDISNLWQNSAINEDGSYLPERTFFNHKEAIFDIFGIEIKFDKMLGYYIADDMSDSGSIRNWLLTSLSVNSSINESVSLRSRISLESVPSGEKYLTIIVRAMKEEMMLEISYQKFTDSEPSTFDVAPYCLKLYRQRWYLLALPTYFDEPGSSAAGTIPHIYALDRILMLQQTRRSFAMPDDFCADEYFADWFGIVHDEQYSPCTIRLKVWEKQRNYFRTLPLHHSQKEIEENPEWSVFEYYMSPTWDLEQELLQYNDNVEVLEPLPLREQMIEHAGNILELYKASR